MQDSHDPRLSPSEIRSRYNHPSWFGSIDSWHRFTAAEIRREIARFWASTAIPGDCVILNAGAGGNDLDLLPDNTINLDISERRIQDSTRPVVGSVEAVPLRDQCVDILLCIGSVINYSDAALTISDFERELSVCGGIGASEGGAKEEGADCTQGEVLALLVDKLPVVLLITERK